MKSLQALFKIRETYIGIAAAIAFQVIFFGVWMTAYDGVDDRMRNLTIGIVNEDTAVGQEISTQMQDSIPFQVQSYASIESAKSAMNAREVDMIIQIPSTLTAMIVSDEQAEIFYWINQSNATLAKTMMENAAVQLNDQVNRTLYPLQIDQAGTQFTEQLQGVSLPEELANQLTQSIVLMLDSLADHPIDASMIKTNEVEGFAANFVPLMVIISSFVGAMVLIMQMEAAVQPIKEVHSKWAIFLARQLINICVAILLPLLTTGLMSIFDIDSEFHFLTIYFFQFMMFWAFLSFAQVFVLLFGNVGMVFNILALSLQLVTSGVLVPRAVLSDWYMNISKLFPATYGADGYYTIIFGGNSTKITENSLALLMIIVVTLLISTLTVFLKKQRITKNI